MNDEDKELWISEHLDCIMRKRAVNEKIARNYLKYLYDWAKREGLTPIPYYSSSYPDALIFLVPDKSQSVEFSV